MSAPLCIYHGHCDDGFAAAWVVRCAAPVFEFYAGEYQQEPPDVTDRHVLLVDFSYKRPVLLEMAAKARSIVILDHHKTAAEDLSGFPEPPPFAKWDRDHNPLIAHTNDVERVSALFDMNRSGAGLAWDFFFAGKPRPKFIDYIEDRDLWRRALPGGDEFTIALRSYPQDFAVWQELWSRGADALIEEGHAIQRYYRQRVEEIKRQAYRAVIAWDEGLFGSRIQYCWIANAPSFAASEVAGELCEKDDAQFGACFFELAGGGWQYSLRSRGDFDVSEVAKVFGGGGHKNAAGFTTPTPVHGRWR